MTDRLRERFVSLWGRLAEALSQRRGVLLALVFVAALIVRLAFSTALGGLGRSPNYDEIRYNSFAVGMLEGRGYSTEYGPTASKPPLFPFFLAGVYFLFGKGEVGSARVVLALIDSLSVLLIFKLGNKLVNPFAGFIAALGAAFYPLFLYMSSQIYPETLFMLVLLVSLLLTVQMVRRENLLYALLAGVLFGCCALIRPNILVFAIFIAIFPFLFRRQGSFAKVLVFAVGTLLLILPWSYRNYRIFNEWIPITTEAGAVLWSDNHAMAAGGTVIPGKDTWPGEDYPDLMWLGWSDLGEVKSNQKFTAAGVDWIRNNPGEFIRLVPKKLFRLWSPAAFTTHSDRYANPLVNLLWIPYAVFLALCALGIWKSFRFWRECWLLYGLILSTNLTTVLFSGGTRYSMPMVPALLIFFGLGLLVLVARVVADERISEPAAATL